MNNQEYVTVRIPRSSIHFEDVMKENCFHNHPERINDEFICDLTQLLEEQLADMSITISL